MNDERSENLQLFSDFSQISCPVASRFFDLLFRIVSFFLSPALSPFRSQAFSRRGHSVRGGRGGDNGRPRGPCEEKGRTDLPTPRSNIMGPDFQSDALPFLPSPDPSWLPALRELARARRQAEGQRLDPWQFAFELPHLRDLGLPHHVLRHLCREGVIELAQELPTPCQERRHFVPLSQPGLPADCCGVLTEQGLAFLERHYLPGDETDEVVPSG